MGDAGASVELDAKPVVTAIEIDSVKSSKGIKPGFCMYIPGLSVVAGGIQRVNVTGVSPTVISEIGKL